VDWKASCRARLGDYLDARGDLAPPWERFPTYERYTIGWRMGAGEDWMGLWSVFLEELPADRESRVAYLKRHAPAPVCWADSVYGVLHPQEPHGDDDPAAASERRTSLLDEGLIASDVAFATWLGQQTDVHWPWEAIASTPEQAARHRTRELWFWSRRIVDLRKRSGWMPPTVPKAWRSCAHALERGDPGPLDPRDGLLSLARMLCAGQVQAPWQLGLAPSDFADSFEDDMGYVDAFRLWGMSVFDDAEQLRRYLDATRAPSNWGAWVAEHLSAD
jgi:hypothetical protein